MNRFSLLSTLADKAGTIVGPYLRLLKSNSFFRVRIGGWMSLRNKCRKPALFDHPFKAEKITLNVNFRKHRMIRIYIRSTLSVMLVSMFTYSNIKRSAASNGYLPVHSRERRLFLRIGRGTLLRQDLRRMLSCQYPARRCRGRTGTTSSGSG